MAFLYFELFESGVPDLNYIISILHPKHIVVMHLPPSMNEEWIAKVEQLRVNFPNIMFFKNSMDSQTISISGIRINNKKQRSSCARLESYPIFVIPIERIIP